jgi:uncharacterized protein (TIGR03382 family)
MRSVVAAAIAVAAVVWAAPRPARACSCAPDPGVTPADGATEVPTNVVLVVRNGPEALDEYVLAGPGGQVAVEVTMAVEQSIYWIALVQPLAPLAPDTEYTLGTGPFSEVRFTTAAGADTVAPEAVALGELTLAHASTSPDGGSSCGDEYSFVDLAITPPADAVAIDVVVTTGDASSRYVVLADRFDWGLSSWNAGCEVRVPLEAGAHTCFEVRARDAAGNLGPPAERCADVTACADIPDAEAFDGDLSDCDPAPPPASDDGGCDAAGPAALGLPLLALLALYAVRRRARYAR